MTEPMQFLNVDLEVGSRFALGPLRAELARRRPNVLELPLSTQTIAAIAALGGRIVITVHAPEPGDPTCRTTMT